MQTGLPYPGQPHWPLPQSGDGHGDGLLGVLGAHPELQGEFGGSGGVAHKLLPASTLPSPLKDPPELVFEVPH